MFGSGLLLPLLLLGGLVVLVLLCWSWMKSTRASQRRQDEQSAEVVRLLREHNELLRRLVDK